MNNDIGKQIAKGTIWTVLMRMSIRLLGIISIIILARVLVPEDYGLVAKAVLIGGLLELITQFGFNAALIKNQHTTQDDYNTVWTLSLIRSVILGFILALNASFIANYFEDSRIEALIYCYALANTLVGFYNVGIVNFQKNMDFEKDFKFNFLKKICSFITTITIALIWETYWSFAIGVLVGNVVGLIASFIMSSYRPSFSLKAFNSLFHFSKWMFLYESIVAISLKMDSFLLSKFGETEDLGVYTISYEVAGIPSTEIAMPVARAALPGLSKLNENRIDFQKMYCKILSSVLVIAIPASVGLSLLAHDITLVVLGGNWIKAGPVISILALFGISRVIIACAISGLIAFDRADLLSKYSLVMLIVKLALLPVAIIYFGYIGLTYAVLITGVIGVINIIIIQKYIGALILTDLFLQIWRIILSTLVMTSVLFVMVPIFISMDNTSIYTLLFLKVILGIAVFIFSLFLLCFISDWKGGPEEDIYNYLSKKNIFNR